MGQVLTRAPGELPAGLVTFVFTDIEGSTLLLRELGPRFPAVLERHRTLLRTCVAEHGGHEVSCDGDSFVAAFADPRAAVTATAAAQDAILDEPWPDDHNVRIRAGIHTGLASPTGGDYVALALHQAARVVAAANGGQVLVTAATVAALGDALGGGLLALGRYRVRDFDEPVELFAVRSDEPPRLRPADRHNLLPPATSLVGRTTELDVLRERAVPGQIVTVVGPGGVGKTRLAVEHGLEAVGRWPAGCWFVDLAVVSDAALVPNAIASAIAPHARPDLDPLEAVLGFLDGRGALLIIDNAEHVRAACAMFARALIATAPSSALLVTSRERLGLAGEVLLRLGPLPVASGEGAPAVALFDDRVRQLDPHGPPLDRGDVTRLCTRLDGLPLAIEMAAARATILTPREILASLDHQTARLRSVDPTVGDRHRSLDRLLRWSDDLLGDDERLLFHRLCVFSGTFAPGAVAAALDGVVEVDAVSELLFLLVNKSLVSAERGAGATRYRLLETVRSYARTRLSDAELMATATRLGEWYLQRVGPGLPLDRIWMGAMADELDNLRGVITVLAEAAPTDAQRLAWSVGQYHDLTQDYRAGIDEASGHVRLLTSPTPERVGLLCRLADLKLRVGDLDGAAADLDVAARLRDQVGYAPWDDVGVERSRGDLALRRGDDLGAARIADEMLRRPLTPFGTGRMWNLRGIACASAGDLAGSAEAFTREVESWSEIGREAMLGSAHGNLAEALLRKGDLAGAARNQLRCLDLAMQFGQPAMIAFSAMMAARLAATTGEWRAAARLQIGAEEELERWGQVLYPTDRAAADELLQTALRNDPLAAAGASGRGIDDVIAIARDVLRSTIDEGEGEHRVDAR